ncbi:hypothetical protein B8W90_12835, partial [Staphylococcus hominis]
HRQGFFAGHGIVGGRPGAVLFVGGQSGPIPDHLVHVLLGDHVDAIVLIDHDAVVDGLAIEGH